MSDESRARPYPSQPHHLTALNLPGTQARPVVAVIISHTHGDHFGGTRGVVDEAGLRRAAVGGDPALDLLAALGPLGAGATTTADTVSLTTDRLDAAALDRLQTLAHAEPGARVRIVETPMTEVFRRALAEASA